MGLLRFPASRIGAAGAAFLACMATAVPADDVSPLRDAIAARKPNFILLLGDDCTMYDIGCYGGQGITPSLDRMAAEGLKFEQAVGSAAICTPTRHCLYTGLSPIRNGGYKNHSSVTPGTRSIVHHLGDLGYRVGIAGKLHIKPKESFPFEEIAGFPENCVMQETPPHSMDGIREFVTRSDEQPYCLVITSVFPHAPHTEGDRSLYDASRLLLRPTWADTPRTREAYRSYLAELTELDRQAGDVMAMLQETGREDDTMFLFASEQGAQFPGEKWTLWDAGIRFGLIARWPGAIPAGQRTNATVQYEDILPTFLEMAGGHPGAEFDGSSFVDVLARETDTHRKYAFSFHANDPEGPPYPIRSIRTSEYKLILNLGWESTYHEVHQTIKKPDSIWWSWHVAAERDPHAAWAMMRHLHRPEVQFYDLRTDPYEAKNVAGDPQYAGIEAQMRTDLEAWMEAQGDPGAAADVASGGSSEGGPDAAAAKAEDAARERMQRRKARQPAEQPPK